MMPRLPSLRTLFRIPAPMQADPYGLNAAFAERKAARPARQAAAKRAAEKRA